MLARCHDVEKVQCPSCPRKFNNQLAMLAHLGKAAKCVHEHQEKVQQGALAAPAKRMKADQAVDNFQKAQKMRVSDALHDLREDHGLGDAATQRVKDSMRSVLDEAEVELRRRLSPLMKSASDIELKTIVHETLKTFRGLETGARENAFMMSRTPYIEPVEHILGKVQHTTVDLEGFTYSSKSLTHKAYYIPMSSNLERLAQNDPQALEMLHRTNKEWSATPPPVGTTKRIYIDIPSGDLFHEHEILGDSQRGNPYWNGRIRICIVLYYDGLEVANPLGFARGKHQLGVFLYSIVNLDATVRTSPPYIQLAGIALESDVKRYGPAKVFSGIDPETHQPDPNLWATPGAQLRLLNTGVPMDILAEDGTRPESPTPVHAHALLLIADMLAAHKLGPWIESPSAYCPCRQCDFDTRLPSAYSPVRFVQDGASCRWKLRNLEEVEKRLAELSLMGSTARQEGMQSAGFNSLLHALDRRWIPYFNVARGCLQDDMHLDDDGIFRNLAYQVWNQLFRKYKLQGFTLDAWNQGMAVFNWGQGRTVPPLHASVLEGAKGGTPSPGTHLRYTASQMNAFILSSRAIAAPFLAKIPGLADDPLWKCWVRAMTHMRAMCAL